MENTVLKIRNLWCAYQKNKPVLYIDQLDIPRGRVIFIIGRSGIGKSTLIETLGLMNNTIKLTDSVSIDFFTSDDTSIKLKDSWTKSNQTIAGFREKHFSFIFQNTNLMPNFSVGENMMVSLLIKGWSIEEARKAVTKVMAQLSLSDDLFDKKITEVSGGQRQRIAFVRAITADFDILFGDEPTGNLDQNTANELMLILKRTIRENNKTAIVVSHDLNLATRFADIIIPITPKLTTANSSSTGLLGEILADNIIRKTGNSWSIAGSMISEPLEAYLDQFLRNDQLKTKYI